MRYIKLFESFVTDQLNKSYDSEQIILECNEILLPLKDNGIDINIEYYGDRDDDLNDILISIGDQDSAKQPSKFCLESYKEDIEHLFSYLSENGQVFDDVYYFDWINAPGPYKEEYFWANLNRESCFIEILFKRK